VPGSAFVPFYVILNDDWTLGVPEEIATAFKAAGVDLADASTPLVASCGTGVTACVLSLGSELAGAPVGYIPRRFARFRVCRA
jgi:thiosulfate/3-mercaptopyruvate sulfurtransferase